MGLPFDIRRLFSSNTAPISPPVARDPILDKQISQHMLFNGRAERRHITASLFLTDTRDCPSMFCRIAVTTLKHGKYTNSFTELELVIAEVACLDDARTPVDHAVVWFFYKSKSQRGQDLFRRSTTKFGCGPIDSDFDWDAGKAETVRNYHRKTYEPPEGQKLKIMSEMIFPINGEDVFLVEELASMANVIGASTPIGPSVGHLYAVSLMEMVSQEKAGMFTGKPQIPAGTISPALRAECTKSWERYKGELLVAKRRAESEMKEDQLITRWAEISKRTEEALRQSERDKEEALRQFERQEEWTSRQSVQTNLPEDFGSSETKMGLAQLFRRMEAEGLDKYGLLDRLARPKRA